MRNKQLLVASALILVFYMSCQDGVVSKDKTSTERFQTVLIKKEVLKKYLTNPSFNFFLLKYDPVFFGGIRLAATPFDINGNVMDKSIKLEKLEKSNPTDLVNLYDGQIYLTKKMMSDNGVDLNTDYSLKPQPYVDSLGKPQSYVSYHFDKPIKAFRRFAFTAFTLDPSPPATMTAESF
jgi:hypothetical protein